MWVAHCLPRRYSHGLVCLIDIYSILQNTISTKYSLCSFREKEPVVNKGGRFFLQYSYNSYLVLICIWRVQCKVLVWAKYVNKEREWWTRGLWMRPYIYFSFRLYAAAACTYCNATKALETTRCLRSYCTVYVLRPITSSERNFHSALRCSALRPAPSLHNMYCKFIMPQHF